MTDVGVIAMKPLIRFAVLSVLVTVARAEMEPSFFQTGPEWINNVQNKPLPDYDPGYPGQPVVEKYGRLVVFEGNEVDRNVAEEYVENYNKTH